MDAEKMLVLAITARDIAAELIAAAERIEAQVRIERAKAQPQIGGLLAKLLEIEELRKNLKNRSLN